jgi:hypothetical protein
MKDFDQSLSGRHERELPNRALAESISLRKGDGGWKQKRWKKK